MANRITEDARKLILDDLILIGNITGGQYVAEFVKRVFPEVEEMEYKQGSRTIPVLNDIARHMDSFPDWEFNYLFDTILDLENVSDEKFIYFVEQYVHPIFKRAYYDEDKDEWVDPTEDCIVAINKGLADAGLMLEATSQTAGRNIYKAVPTEIGTQEPIKNIIFAAKYKPDIVLNDVMSNVISIVNANGALVYDCGIPSEGITWNRMIDWYSGVSPDETERNLAKRFYDCLDSDVEKLFFKSYISVIKELGKNIPALIPQVYLYYDPKNQSQRELKIFEHQKMDFIMIMSPMQRIVIEIDGQQHYADDTHAPGNEYKYYASPSRYAEMMKAHREMSLAGYDVYRFGGKELWIGGGVSQESITTCVKEFFMALFQKYRIL